MTKFGFDSRFTVHYIVSTAVCLGVIWLVSFYRKASTVPVVDENPVTVQLPKGTPLYNSDDCYDVSEFGKTERQTEALIRAASESNRHNLLVETADGWRGWVKQDVFAEGVLPRDHRFPCFIDDRGHRFSGSLKGFEGKRLEELEKELGLATAIVPAKGGFTATFRMELYNSADHRVYNNPSIRFIDSLAVDTVMPQKSRGWSWSQWNPLFRMPIWLGYQVTPKQYRGYVTLDEKLNKSLNVWVKFEPKWLQVICNILLGILYIALVFFVFIRIPLLFVLPLPYYIKYNNLLSPDTTNTLLALVFFIAYIAVVPFIVFELSTTIWNLVWLVVFLAGGCYVCGKWITDVDEKKCTRCYHYDSYDLTEHRYTHTTIEQRAETHTTHETRRGHTTSGQAVDVDVEVHHTNYYNVEVKHFDDTYTCRYCGQKKYDKSTEETRLD